MEIIHRGCWNSVDLVDEESETVGVEATSCSGFKNHEAPLEPDLNIVKYEETEPTTQMIVLEISKEDSCDYNEENSCDPSNFLSNICGVDQ